MFQTQKFITCMQYIAIRSQLSVHAKPGLSQVNVRQNFSAPVFNDVTDKNLEIISQIVLWYENIFCIDWLMNL